MKNSDNFAPDLVEDIKYVGYFMYFCAAVTALLAWAVDGYYILDTFLCAYLGYRACYKPGKYVMLWISVYYGISIALSFVEGGVAVHGYVIKFAIMYWIGSTTFKAFKELSNEKLKLINAS